MNKREETAMPQEEAGGGKERGRLTTDGGGKGVIRRMEIGGEKMKETGRDITIEKKMKGESIEERRRKEAVMETGTEGMETETEIEREEETEREKGMVDETVKERELGTGVERVIWMKIGKEIENEIDPVLQHHLRKTGASGPLLLGH